MIVILKMKNKLFLFGLILILTMPLAWYGFSVGYYFRLLPVALEDDIVVSLIADGRSVEVSVLNDSNYTISSFNLSCKSTVHSGNCSIAGMIEGIVYEGFPGYKRENSCRTLTNDVHESLIKKYVFPSTIRKELIETKDAWSTDSLSCAVEDPRGYKSYWLERFIGNIIMIIF